ncbi:hypothetical protein GOP47_0006246 [Adiantum capillus-veneris]|uniref:Protein artemis n=1 Tax=Adiantum capillus-veneris TaxID=13818 RepID=A0A9D4V331_ADICA|nr:hypothetical protein GOP47_0006246 [Adiantum capillus-veneris]
MAADGEEGARLFAVDKWGCRKSKVFFLTHMHADHTKGLSQRWRRGPIYCSAITAALLLLKFPALDIRILPLSTTTLIPLPSPHLLEVTAIDANHCPGSVMFVFRGAFGCILHTGDFRWESGSPNLELMKGSIASAIGGSQVNLVHLDNTFCNPQFYFPPRHVAAQQVVDIITNHKGFDALIGVDMLGKEELLIYVANTLNTKIWVWPQRMQTMKVLGITEFFTTDSSATKIRAVPRYSISNVTLSMLNEITPTVAVLPSGLNCLGKTWVSSSAHPHMPSALSEVRVELHSLKKSRTGSNVLRMEEKESKKNQMGEKYIYCVPYSLHCCFSELEEFLRYIKPLSVKGNLSSSNVNVSPLLGKQSIDENKANHFSERNHISGLNEVGHWCEQEGLVEHVSTHNVGWITDNQMVAIGMHSYGCA